MSAREMVLTVAAAMPWLFVAVWSFAQLGAQMAGAS